MLVKCRGFTVMELMIVVAVVAVLAAIAAPSFRGTLANSRVKTAATDIHLSLLRARSEAIKRNADVTVAAAGGGWTAGWTISGGIETHEAVSGSGVAIEGDESVTYRSSGRTSAGAVAISVTSPDTSTARCVTVALSGQPVVGNSACP